MKYFIIAFLLLSSLCWAEWIPLNSFNSSGEQISVLNQTSEAIILEVSIPGFETEEITEQGITYQRISLWNYNSSTLDIGKPEIPSITANIGIPENADVSYEILNTEAETFTNYKIYPFQEPTTDYSTNHEFFVDKGFYTKNVNYPASLVKLSKQKTWRDITLSNLTVYPFQYNPAKQELTVFKKMVIKMYTKGGDRVTKNIPRRFNAMYKNGVLNYEWMPVTTTRDADINYLAIIYDSYINAAAPLTDWYHKKGITIDVVPSSTAGSNSSAIKSYITNHYNTYNTEYVLFIGDVAQIPTYTGYGTASDAWYSFISGGDLYAELAIGRLSASSTGEVTDLINKVLKYDKDPPLSDWLTKSSLVAHKEDYPGKYSQCKREIYNYSYSYFTPTMDTIMGAISGNNNSKVTTTINEGRNVVNYRGHGDTYIWWQWNYLNEHWHTSDVYALSNGNKTPVVFNIACVCGDITVSECLTEAWLRKDPGGAVAALGATNPSYTTPNHTYDKYLYRGYCDSTIWNIGWTSNYAAAIILPSGYYAEENVKMYLWVGDPMTEIWTAVPTDLNVSHAPTVPLGPSDFTVTVYDSDSKAPVENALVCAMKAPETWVSDFTNASGEVVLSINPASPGTLYVTATAHDFLPYEGFALANTGPYCIYNSHSIDDVSGGNGDGFISPFEDIDMAVTLQNIGVEPSKDVIANLRLESANSNITLVDTVSNFGDIQPDSTKQGTPPYSFSVAGGCPNGDTIYFEIEIMDSAGNDWLQTFTEVVWSPQLTYEGLVIEDAGQAIPNGILNAGEVVDGIVSLRNSNDYAHATGLSAILHISDAYVTATDSTGSFPDISPGATEDNSGDPFVLEASYSLPFEYEVDVELYVSGDNVMDTLYFTFIAGKRTEEDPTGPDDYAYWAYDMTDTLYTECPTYNWIEIDPNYGGDGTELVLGSNETEQLELPFSFMYYGDNYDTISVCSNGWLALGVTEDSSFRYYPIPDPNGPPLCVAPFWDDLDPVEEGGVYYKYDSSIHGFIVEWSRIYHKQPGDEETFQVILSDPAYNPTVTGDGEIFCQYLIVKNTATSCTGIEDESETIGLEYRIGNYYDPGSAVITDAFALKFTTDPPEYVGIAEGKDGVKYPRVFGLSQNVPNPFYSRTRIRYQVPIGYSGYVSLKVYDVSGKLVRTLIDGEGVPGWYSVYWDGRDRFGSRVSSGIYFTRFSSGDYSKTGKMLYLR
jgi:hypothetical protein